MFFVSLLRSLHQLYYIFILVITSLSSNSIWLSCFLWLFVEEVYMKFGCGDWDILSLIPGWDPRDDPVLPMWQHDYVATCWLPGCLRGVKSPSHIEFHEPAGAKSQSSRPTGYSVRTGVKTRQDMLKSTIVAWVLLGNDWSHLRPIPQKKCIGHL